MDKVYEIIEEIHQKKPYESLPFFELLEKSTCPSDISKIMNPFYYAVENWLPHLKAFRSTLSKKNFQEAAMIIKRNIDDEEGVGAVNSNLDQRHTITFLKFLFALSTNNFPVLTESVAIFNRTLDETLQLDSIVVNAFLLGTIEYIYSDISKRIGEYCHSLGIKQTHYELHETLDLSHATDLFEIAIMVNDSKDFETERYRGIQRGYNLIYFIFDNMYKDAFSKI